MLSYSIMRTGYTDLLTPPVYPNPLRRLNVLKTLDMTVFAIHDSWSMFHAPLTDQLALNCSLLPKLFEPSERTVPLKM